MLHSIARACPRSRLCFRVRHQHSTFAVQAPSRTFASGLKKRPPQPKAPTRLRYPERLLVYHAGTGRIVFIGCSKISTLFLLIFSAFWAAPTLHALPGEPNWMAAAVIAGGAIPLLFVGRATAPFTAYAHLRLPALARQSPETFQKWSQQIPTSTEIDLTTMRLIGVPRVTRFRLGELRRKRESGFGDIANLVAVESKDGSVREGGVIEVRKLRKKMRRFFVGKQSLNARGFEAGTWERVWKRIPLI